MSGVFQNIDPHPLTARRVCTPPPLVRGEDTLARGRGGGGSIVLVRKTPDTALYSIYVSTLWYHKWAEHSWSPRWPFSGGWQHVRPCHSLKKKFRYCVILFSVSGKSVYEQRQILQIYFHLYNVMLRNVAFSGIILRKISKIFIS